MSKNREFVGIQSGFVLLLLLGIISWYYLSTKEELLRVSDVDILFIFTPPNYPTILIGLVYNKKTYATQED